MTGATRNVPTPRIAARRDPTSHARRNSTRQRLSARISTSAELDPQQAVVSRAAAGDEQAFAQLYALHHRRVYWLCVRMTHNAAEAEDLTQDVFLQAYRRLNTYRGESAFSTWLHRVAVNVVLMHLRKHKRLELSLDALTDDEENGAAAPQELHVHDLLLAGCIDRVTLEQAIDRLAPGYRICFLLHDVEGYEHHEVAEMLSVTEGSSKSQLHKARMRLRQMLSDHTARDMDDSAA